MAAPPSSSDPNPDPSWQSQLQSSVSLLKEWLEQNGMQSIVVPFGAIVASFLLTGHGSVIWYFLVLPVWRLVMTIIGTTIGVGLGLGFALHVREHLQRMTESNSGNNNDDASTIRLSTAAAPSSTTTITDASGMKRIMSPRKGPSLIHAASSTGTPWGEEDTMYASLMTTAGYDVGDHVLRGQVVKGSSRFFERYYPFTKSKDPEKWRSVILMKEQWPTLPASISFELGRFMEYTVRDFIASWYYFIDPGVVYEDERQKRKEMENQADSADNTADEGVNAPPPPPPPTKAMVFSTGKHRPAPMMSAMYQSLGIVFGNLATRVEGVNLFSLILIKWVKVLSQTFRVYRKLRSEAVKKQRPTPLVTRNRSLRGSLRSVTESTDASSVQGDQQQQHSSSTHMLEKVSEMAVARQFMIKGKLHRAMTFGMDVPSLLFGDARGEECGVGGAKVGKEESDDVSKELKDEKPPGMREDVILEQRLFGAKILYECEMDYNRVLSHRLLRALLPRAEFSSPIIRTMMTEMLAGCVLTPLMGSFCPEYLNGWIVMGCAENSEDEKKDEGPDTAERKEPIQDEELPKGLNDEGVTTELTGEDQKDEKLDVLTELSSEASHLSGSGPAPSQGYELTMSGNVLNSASTGDVSDACQNGVEMTMSQADFFKPKESGITLDEEVDIDGLDDANNSLLDDSDERSGTLVDAHDDEEIVEKVEEKPLPTGDFVLPLLSMSLIDLQRFMEFQECRDALANQKEVDVKWDDPEMQACISQLVLVVEASLLHGRRKHKLEYERESTSVNTGDDVDDCGKGIEVAITTTSFSKVLMEITADPDEFEDKILQEEEEYMTDDIGDMEETTRMLEMWETDPSDLSTLRSLIAAWLQSGQAHRVMSVLMNAKHAILRPFFHKHAFLRTRENAEGFVRQLRQLNGIHILVDTVLVLEAPNMDVNEDGKVVVPGPESKSHVPENPNTGGLRASLVAEQGVNRKSMRFQLRGLSTETEQSSSARAAPVVPAAMTLPQAYVSSTGLPRFLDFRRNENFSSSLRADRERRMQSWANATMSDTSQGLQIICRLKGASEAAVAAHREMHQISRIFYAGTNMLALRHGARRQESEGETVESVPLSLLTLEMACQRRRLEVPDDDSSFLLRAQPRPLNAIGVHRDQRNHDMSFKCFAATYEEPAFRPGQAKYTGGRYVRPCLLRYFPNDRTAQIVIPNETRSLDQRKVKDADIPKNISVKPSSVPFLPSEFLKERHLCQKWTPKGATPRSGSILSSSVMETADFNAVPRSGKAIDFVYRMSLFERPMVELSGKRFMIHDNSSVGPHRADASCLEMSDAALSIALLTIGGEFEIDEEESSVRDDIVGTEKKPKCKLSRRSSVEMGSDGYPIVWMKYTRKQGENNVTEVKSYRTSYIRAALMIKDARQDAQLQCLVRCVIAGSARSATKQRTEAYLQPTAKLLEYANSPQREKQSVLLRDLKLGMNNIDKAQLRRNGLLSPRFPTELRGFVATCEGAAQVKEQNTLAMPGMMATVTMYKIRCVALIAIDDADASEDDLAPYASTDGTHARLFREEWVVYRPMRDIQSLHKHLKTQVAAGEQSASAGARLVGAATAAFAVSGSQGSSRRRKLMIPSLNQAQKAGLVTTKKSIQKRCEIVNGYFKYLLAIDHPLNRCSELLMFLGAFYPFPADVKVGGDPVTNKTDPLGRMEMKRITFDANPQVREAQSADSMDDPLVSTRSLTSEAGTAATAQSEVSIELERAAGMSIRSTGSGTNDSNSVRGAELMESTAQSEERKARVKEIDMIPSIKAKIDEVPLAQVRSALFDLVRYQFDFDNANFFRSRMFAALKTMSLAVATPGEFRKMLYEAHVEYLNADSLAGWVKFLTDMIFPDGLFMQFSGPTPPEELDRLSQQAKDALPKVFPDQLRAVLGADIVQGGMDVLHEMLQNRIVLKSMSYMLFDLLWLEVFPELHDILTGPAALEVDY